MAESVFSIFDNCLWGEIITCLGAIPAVKYVRMSGDQKQGRILSDYSGMGKASSHLKDLSEQLNFQRLIA